MALIGQTVAAAAQPALWRTLEVGDTPDETLADLQAMPEVKRVKNKMKRGVFDQQDIDMVEGAVPIFDGRFSIQTGFTDGQLSVVKLTSGRGCAKDGHALAEKIETELLKKYPENQMKLIGQSEFMLRALDATSLEPTSTVTSYLSDDVATFLTVRFYREDPPSYYGGSSLNRSIYNLAKTMYDQRAAACGGMGYLTAEIGITYISRADYDGKLEAIKADDADDRRKAADNL